MDSITRQPDGGGPISHAELCHEAGVAGKSLPISQAPVQIELV